MIIYLVKIVVMVFFGYIAFDAHMKTRNLKKEAEDQRFNRHVLEVRARRERVRSVIYTLITLAVLATLFFRTVIE